MEYYSSNFYLLKTNFTFVWNKLFKVARFN